MVTQASGSLSHRRDDIQGLRAIAVCAVVAYHAGVPLPGGYVGVDIFFAISGFVITAMLLREWQRNGRISLTQFYLRRFRRLAPALAVMIAGTMVLTTLFLSPYGPQSVAGKTGLAALVLSANWAIATLSGGYFDTPASKNPLLHTWSLSVEEQFYVFFPTVLLLALLALRGRSERARRLGLFAVLAVVSGLSLLLLRGGLFGIPQSSWLQGFYSPITRVWEFGLGALVAVAEPLLRRMPRAVAVLAAVAGTVGLGWSLFFLDDTVQFPSKWALPSVIGTTALIAAGCRANPLARVLAARPMVTIGDLSYSLYLWHWPPIVVASVLFPLHPWARAVAAAASIVPAIVSFRFIEEPLRRGSIAGRRLLRTLAATTLVPAVASAGVILAQPAWANSMVEFAHLPQQPAIAGMVGQPCTDPKLAGAIGSLGDCFETHPGRQIDFVVVGDSHSENLFRGFADELPTLNIALYSVRVPQFLGGADLREAVSDRINATSTARAVIVSRSWERRGIPDVEVDSVRAFADAVARPGRPVFISLDVPTFPFEGYQCRDRTAPVVFTSHCTMPSEQHRRQVEVFQAQLRQVAGATGARLVDPTPAICDASACSMQHEGNVLYTDETHLTGYGSILVARQLLSDVPALKAALGP